MQMTRLWEFKQKGNAGIEKFNALWDDHSRRLETVREYPEFDCRAHQCGKLLITKLCKIKFCATLYSRTRLIRSHWGHSFLTVILKFCCIKVNYHCKSLFRTWKLWLLYWRATKSDDVISRSHCDWRFFSRSERFQETKYHKMDYY